MSAVASVQPKKSRLQFLQRVAFCLAVVLFVKTLVMVVAEYRNYFPANFESNFLSGKEAFFAGSYQYAFYIHICTGPIVLLVAPWLMFSGTRKPYLRLHRVLGKSLVYLTLFFMLPSGLVMATRALTGPIAGVSFFLLSGLTAVSIVMSAWHARNRRFVVHRVWATRSFLLLASPLALRLMTGATIFLDVETEWTYRFAAWGSWLIPLAAFELRRWIQMRQVQTKSRMGVTL